jgi:predicted MPP superfamily phosphohydrolase
LIFIASLLLIISSEIIFANSLISNSNSWFQFAGYLHLTTFICSFVLLIVFFRSRDIQFNYRKGFTVFGILIVLAIPTLAYLIPGTIYIFIQYDPVKWLGWILTILLIIGFIVGIFFGRWNWKIHRVELTFSHLPEEAHKIKLVQISDIHVGSFFNNHNKVKKAIRKINSLNADYVFFTGDLVNNSAEELHGWEEIFTEIHAQKGKFSILGNHDYGDYVKWGNENQKNSNLKKLLDLHRTLGFTPLLNDSIELTNGFWLLGVENWGKAPFRQSGKLNDTLKNIPDDHFKLLLSHDPSHFDEQVINTNIDLTLSGHTHGMQFGIERFGLKWSPVSFKYKKWAGLYQEGNQYLYVNRGFGYIGFPGRVGIYPEITEIILKKK